MSLTPIISASDPVFHFRNHVYIVPVCTSPRPSILFHCNRLKFAQLKARASEESCGNQSVSPSSRNHWWPNLARPLVDLSATSLLLLALGIYAFSFSDKRSNALAAVNAAAGRALQEDSISKDDISGGEEKNVEDEQLLEEFENWKSKTYALTVPLRVVALQGSVPPAWIKDFIQSQGRRLKFSVQFRGSLEDIFSELLGSSGKANASPKSAIAADLITIGDSWLDLAIGKSIIEPLENAEDCDWFKNLADIWKVYLRRNNEGKNDPEGRTWAVPYRWGSMVIAYKKNKFDKFGLAPIEDWKDLWRPELAGKISMIDSPREIVGAVLKYMGASYNTNDISKEIPGGISSVQQNLLLLAKQVLLFDSGNYLKAFNISDSWVAVGWSSDILPAAKRMSNVAVVVPKSGASLWTDLWAIPATTRCPPSEDFGGRVRGPSPVIHQWLDFCQQPAQELPFKQGVFPGASPSALADVPSDASKVLPKGAPELVTNLIAGIPPPEILAKCEFLEPLSEATLSDYNWLISTMKESDPGPIQQCFSTIFQASWTKFKFLRGENR